MKENLRTTHYSDGWPMEHGITYSSTDGYYYYPGNNNSTENVVSYGLLYNWPAVMRDEEDSESIPSGVQGVCPEGWHVPSMAELNALADYVSAQTEYLCDGGIAKSLCDSIGWDEQTTSCTPGYDFQTNNLTGFSARGAGVYSGYYHNIRDFQSKCFFWSTTRKTNYPEGIWWKGFAAGSDAFYTTTTETNILSPHAGYSVRCLRDY